MGGGDVRACISATHISGMLLYSSQNCSLLVCLLQGNILHINFCSTFYQTYSTGITLFHSGQSRPVLFNNVLQSRLLLLRDCD